MNTQSCHLIRINWTYCITIVHLIFYVFFNMLNHTRLSGFTILSILSLHTKLCLGMVIRVLLQHNVKASH